ncbi:MAG: hypothetical protein EOQ64_23600 [Mesorhizobium sp.]|uniref:hypothetical protein n=1 Tax=Mesorhizobium sp. TaxID=1871066 RepID=UPI000FE6583C|nr:hypothetical protein [Mesorhizobium sp.]RWG53637.1 MAG: hypothetical protein EOQ64_23600 [Mesorhizobium sp.]RWH36292.1 MAG: hypothetical protein EOQ78_26280 [Mesorhizobium sp.]
MFGIPQVIAGSEPAVRALLNKRLARTARALPAILTGRNNRLSIKRDYRCGYRGTPHKTHVVCLFDIVCAAIVSEPGVCVQFRLRQSAGLDGSLYRRARCRHPLLLARTGGDKAERRAVQAGAVCEDFAHSEFLYLGIAFFFTIMMIMLFAGMGLRRYAEWTGAA